MDADGIETVFDRFITDPPPPDLDTKKIIKILQEIKGLKE